METRENVQETSLSGVLFGGTAFLIWGLSPVYWKSIQAVPATEIVMHRVVWSFFFLLPLILWQGRWHELTGTLKNRRNLGVLMATAFIVSGNWLLYIWAVNSGRVLEASLGYYINPLVNVFLGMIFLKERLRRTQVISVVLAGAGVLYLTLHYGTFPWVALTLAFSFGLYGLIRKVVPVGALVGLSVETLILSIPAVGYLIFLNAGGTGAFLHRNMTTDISLMGASIVTAVPLLLFTLGTRRLTLATIGFLQYIGPTCMLLLGILVYGETLSPAQVFTFALIWLALAIYSADSVMTYRRLHRTPVPGH